MSPVTASHGVEVTVVPQIVSAGHNSATSVDTP